MYFDLISAEYILDIGLSVFVLSMNNKFGPTGLTAEEKCRRINFICSNVREGSNHPNQERECGRSLIG